MKNIKFFICLVLFGFSSLSSVYSQDKQEAELTSFSGEVQVILKGEKDYSSVEEGMKFEAGDEIKVNDGASAELSFNESNTNIVRLGDNSDVKISFSEDEKLELLSGEAFATISELPSGSSFEIRTPTAVSGARGTDWVTKVTDEGTDIEAINDVPYVRHFENDGILSKQATNISPGQMTTVKKFERPMNFRPVPEERRKQWKDIKPQMHKRAYEAIVKRNERPTFNREEFREKMKQKQKDIREGKIPGERQKDGRGSGALDGSLHAEGRLNDKGMAEEGERLKARQSGFREEGNILSSGEASEVPGMKQKDRFRDPGNLGAPSTGGEGMEQRIDSERRQQAFSDGTSNREKRMKGEGFVPAERSLDKGRMQDLKAGERLDRQGLEVGDREKLGSRRQFSGERENIRGKEKNIDKPFDERSGKSADRHRDRLPPKRNVMPRGMQRK